MKQTAFLYLLLALLLGCAAKPDLSLERAGIVAVKPGDLAADRPLWSAAQAEAFKADFLTRRYSVWAENYEFNATRIGWPWTSYTFGKGYGANRLPLNEAWFNDLALNAQIETYPNRSTPGLSLRAVDLRNFPTEEPFFKDFKKAGEGYPFDYLQNSRLYPQHPVRITHQSARGDWIFVESDHAHGWVRPHEIAVLTQAEAAYLGALPLGAVVREKTAVYDLQNRFLFEADIGALLPVTAKGDPVAVTGGKIITAQADRTALQPWPIAPSEGNLAKLADRALGRFYGWGGLEGGRDCSSLMRDLFAAVGRFLPRNSNQQAKAGEERPFASPKAADRLAQIRAEALPFATLINFPGHVGLYLGEQNGEGLLLHAAWGHRVLRGDYEDRLIIGQTAITTLRAGSGLDELRPNGLIDRAVSMTLIDKELP